MIHAPLEFAWFAHNHYVFVQRVQGSLRLKLRWCLVCRLRTFTGTIPNLELGKPSQILSSLALARPFIQSSSSTFSAWVSLAWLKASSRRYLWATTELSKISWAPVLRTWNRSRTPRTSTTAECDSDFGLRAHLVISPGGGRQTLGLRSQLALA